MEKKEDKKKKINFKKYFIYFIILLVTIVLYSRFLGTEGLLIKEINIVNENIPSSFEGIKIVHFSDLHYGRTVNKDELSYIVKTINNLNPDIVLFTGDLIDKDIEITDEIKEEVTMELKNIKSLLGNYAIEGNHDTYNSYYETMLEEAGFVYLYNNYDIVYNKDLSPIFLGGIGNTLLNNDDIDNTLNYFENNDDLFKIMLIHEPDFIDEIKNENIDLVLAGHSHNGQFRVPIIGKIYTPVGAKNYYDEYYKVSNTDLYISSGIGCSFLNFRLFNRPSINFYRITKK